MLTLPALAPEALLEALANGGLLIPAESGDGRDAGESYSFRSAPGDGAGERTLFAFTDREALASGPAWVGETAVILRGTVAISAFAEQEFSALRLNADGPGELVLPRAAVLDLNERQRAAPRPEHVHQPST